MTAGRHSYTGTDKEKKQVQVRLPVHEVADVIARNYYEFDNLTQYIVDLWNRDRLKRERKDKRSKK